MLSSKQAGWQTGQGSKQATSKHTVADKPKLIAVRCLSWITLRLTRLRPRRSELEFSSLKGAAELRNAPHVVCLIISRYCEVNESVKEQQRCE